MDITFKDVTHIYQEGTPLEKKALDHVDLTIPDGSFTAIIGQTGSGKSTLIQHLNGLLQPTAGEITVGNYVITAQTNQSQLKQLRKKVGVVFQFPENQLFEETVLKDIAFGPRNFGVDEATALERAQAMCQLVGLPDEVGSKLPFDLSGGQMRRVAIAGILAMNPEVLVLDEPTAGLDPKGHEEMLALFEQLHRQYQLTVVLVSHHMDDVARYADQVLVIEQGRLIKSGTPHEIFENQIWLTQHGLRQPSVAEIVQALTQKGLSFSPAPLTLTELTASLTQQYEDLNHE